MEHIVASTLTKHFNQNDILYDLQHGFRERRSFETQLIQLVEDLARNMTSVLTMYWLPKLHKRPYKARFIANSSSFTTTEISKLLTSCLTAIKAKVIKHCETVYES